MLVTIIVLLVIAIGLLVFSMRASGNSSQEEERMEDLKISFLQEVQDVQKEIRSLELDLEIVAKDAGIQLGNDRERKLKRELLDLYKRGYSLEGIAKEKRLPVDEVEKKLNPYIRQVHEGGKVVNGA
ncbi:hypothetical protein [Alkalihalobacillus pseudalcaliphilus]|uniref:hypothetical protein n=1 Tax=Alkalihalobacillus pseudalcaliphilus TaxID=79884 RepID=UPI00069D9009|nr:hypothetical protein [Alkalihalobacillus pseudalcaliphilus]